MMCGCSLDSATAQDKDPWQDLVDVFMILHDQQKAKNLSG
jgi:hypothetical protein